MPKSCYPTISVHVNRNSQCAQSGMVVSGCDGHLDGWTGGVKLAANSRLKAVCATADLLRLGVGSLIASTTEQSPSGFPKPGGRARKSGRSRANNRPMSWLPLKPGGESGRVSALHSKASPHRLRERASGNAHCAVWTSLLNSSWTVPQAESADRDDQCRRTWKRWRDSGSAFPTSVAFAEIRLLTAASLVPLQANGRPSQRKCSIRSILLPSTNAVPQAAPSSAQNRQAMERGEKGHSCEPT
jgi:hypothetical protein